MQTAAIKECLSCTRYLIQLLWKKEHFSSLKMGVVVLIMGDFLRIWGRGDRQMDIF